MLAIADRLFREAMTLPLEERADLIDHLIASSAEAIAPEIEKAHLEEIYRRITRVEAGKSQLIDGEQVFAEVRAMLAGLEAERREK